MLARPNLPSFNYVKPNSADEVVSILNEYGSDARLLMGGTDLFNQMRQVATPPKMVVDLKNIPGIQEITFDKNRGLMIGAGVNMNRIASNPEVKASYGLLALAASSVASYQLRTRATIGGNLCNASPCADTIPACYIFDARMLVYGPTGFRVIPASSFHRGPGRTNLNPGEFLAAVEFPTPPLGTQGRYYKLGRSKLGDLAIVSVAVLGYPSHESKSGFEFRIALGAVGPTVLRASNAENYLKNAPANDVAFSEAAELAREASSPISDVRAGKDYRREMIRNLTYQGLKDVFSQLRGSP